VHQLENVAKIKNLDEIVMLDCQMNKFWTIHLSQL